MELPCKMALEIWSQIPLIFFGLGVMFHRYISGPHQTMDAPDLIARHDPHSMKLGAP